MTAFGKLTRRSEFTAARKGRRAHAPAFTTQIARRTDGPTGARAGLTVTRKTGDSVERNRIKRRLRAALREVGADTADPACDHVFIANRAALTAPFTNLTAAIAAAIAPRPAKRRPSDSSSAGA